MKTIRRINLFGGAGCGKSTLAAELFADLKKSSYNVEHVHEYIKDWAIEGRAPKSWDQGYVFAKQVHKEDVPLRSGIELIVTDSPILMNVSYSVYYNFEACDELVSMANKFEQKYPSLNFYLHRKFAFVQAGRYGDEEYNKKIDAHIKMMMERHLDPSYTYYDDLGYEQMLEIIKDRINY